jgi:hypothetical protein
VVRVEGHKPQRPLNNTAQGRKQRGRCMGDGGQEGRVTRWAGLHQGCALAALQGCRGPSAGYGMPPHASTMYMPASLTAATHMCCRDSADNHCTQHSRSGMLKGLPLTWQSSEGMAGSTGEKRTTSRTTCSSAAHTSWCHE